MDNKKIINWNLIFLFTGIFLIELLLIIALLGNWLVGTLRIIAWIIFSIILAGIIIWIVWYLINFLWKNKEEETTKTLSIDDCIKLSNKILLFQYGIIPSKSKHSKQQMIHSTTHPVFFRKVYDVLEEKIAYVGIRLENTMQKIGHNNPQDMIIIIDPKDEKEVYDAMMALSGTRDIKTKIEKTVLDETGMPQKTVKVESDANNKIELDDGENKDEEKSQKEVRRTKQSGDNNA